MEGNFLFYQAQVVLEGDRIVEGDTRDDLFSLTEHKSDTNEWSCSLDPKVYSNFGRYIGGVSPTCLDDANCIAYTVQAGGFYHIIIVIIKNIKAGDALQYYYKGLADESFYKKIEPVPVPSS